mgnify:CR=1 FL=1
MAIRLEELKRQREQIQKHLAWLDDKIAELTQEAKVADDEKSSPSPSQEAQLYTSPTVGEDTSAEEAEPPNTGTFPPELDAPTYKAKTQGELKRAKIGCILFFILGIALFLFLLFGLPYLM